MDYKVSPGLPESELSPWLKDAAKQLGTFSDGRVNYSSATLAPAVMCIIYCKPEILLVKRGLGLADADGYWSTVNGFIDQDISVQAIAANELSEELQLKVKPENITIAKSMQVKNVNEKRAYIIFPCLIKLDTKPNITLNSENTEFAWILRADLEKYDILADLPIVVDAALNLL